MGKDYYAILGLSKDFTPEDLKKAYRKIPLVTALAGGTVSIQHFNKTLPLQLRDVISPGQERAIGGEGMPISKTPGKRGDLVVRFEVSFPRSLTEDQKSKLRTLLPSS